jgi:hypothetical protein
METIILIGIACYTVLRLIELFGKFFFENKPQEIILKPDPRIKGLIDTYKQVSDDLMCDKLADSHAAVGASAAYQRVIKDLEGLK